MEKIKIKAFVSILLIFVAGVAVGAVVSFFLMNHNEEYDEHRYSRFRFPSVQHRNSRSKPTPFRYPRSRYEQGSRRHLIEYLSKELNLTPEQEQGIENIIIEAHKEFESVWKNEIKKHREMSIEVRKKIMELLNEEQKKKFEQMRKDHRQRRSKFRKR